MRPARKRNPLMLVYSNFRNDVPRVAQFNQSDLASCDLLERETLWCLCIPIFVTMFPEWLSGTEPWPRTPGAVRPSLLCLLCFCMHMYSFAGLIRRTPPPTFSDTAITDRHSDTTIFHLRAHWVRISWSIGSALSFGHVPPVRVEPSTSCVNGEHPIH